MSKVRKQVHCCGLCDLQTSKQYLFIGAHVSGLVELFNVQIIKCMDTSTNKTPSSRFLLSYAQAHVENNRHFIKVMYFPSRKFFQS